MSRKNSTAVVGEEPAERTEPRHVVRGPRAGGGLFGQYKPEQGMWTRRGTFIGAGLLIAWGAKFVYDQLSVYQGDEAWRVLITTGIPILFLVVLGTAAWRLSFSGRKSGDFMIATEGEMKKVNWSTKKEVVGSTIVVITMPSNGARIWYRARRSSSSRRFAFASDWFSMAAV